MEWFEVHSSRIRDGYYWWRSGRDDRNLEIFQIRNGSIIDYAQIEQDAWDMFEHKDFSGQWWGPIPRPDKFGRLMNDPFN